MLISIGEDTSPGVFMFTKSKIKVTWVKFGLVMNILWSDELNIILKKGNPV